VLCLVRVSLHRCLVSYHKFLVSFHKSVCIHIYVGVFFLNYGCFSFILGTMLHVGVASRTFTAVDLNLTF